MSDDLPYRAEYAKSRRSLCKGCESHIAKEALRLAVIVQSPTFDKKIPGWYHFECFFGCQRPKTVGDIAHFESLRWEDQEKIKAKIEGGGSGGGGNNIESSKGRGKKRKAAAADSGLQDFTIEYAKSNDSTCRECEEKIMKPSTMISVDVVDNSKKSKSIFTENMPSKVKVQLKGGAAVDPDSKLEDDAHVYKKNDDIYSVVLSLTNIQSGKNSYYKLQVLESDRGNRYWLFRSWGHIGTNIGGNKLDNDYSQLEAVQHFEDLYEKRTGNIWSNRKNFQEVRGRYFPVDLDYSQDEDVDALLDAANCDISCKLAMPVQELVKLIFDVKLMERVILEFELNLEKMPLGKLSKNQIQQAYSVLSDLQELVKSGGPKSSFVDASNRFYTLVPHAVGVENPPVLKSEKMIKQKFEMLERLLDIKIAYSMVKTKSDVEGDVHPLDALYAKLNTHIEVLDKQTDEFKLLQQYARNTHAATHTEYDLEILEVFKVKRSGEEKRYRKFRKLHNRKLLWHGSPLTNFEGILSQGLQIPPPEALDTVYKFGKGIYFTDMVSKSANYCSTSPNNSTGLMLLCEVALGNMYECKRVEHIKKLPKNKHSTKALGITEPDPKASVQWKDGVEVPVGKGVSTTRNDVSWLYNEYIVYDVAQVNIQYLLKMDFKYKY